MKHHNHLDLQFPHCPSYGQITKLLVEEYGLLPTAVDKFKQTPLFFAAKHGNGRLQFVCTCFAGPDVRNRSNNHENHAHLQVDVTLIHC